MATEVKIAEFKSRLSEYLRRVRRGQEIIVKDRETPIARVVPYSASRERLQSIPPTKSLKDVEKLFQEIKSKGITVKPEDFEEVMRWDRRDRFENDDS